MDSVTDYFIEAGLEKPIKKRLRHCFKTKCNIYAALVS